MNVVYPTFQTTIIHSNTNRDIMDIIRNQNNDLLYNYSDQMVIKSNSDIKHFK